MVRTYISEISGEMQSAIPRLEWTWRELGWRMPGKHVKEVRPRRGGGSGW